MSGSRKKQERKAAEEPVITSRAQEEQMKEAQRKRNTLIYTIVGAVIAILVIALLIWNSGVIQRGATVAEIGGEKVTAGEVAFYYYSNDVISTAQMYASYGLTGFPYDSAKSPKDQIITESSITDLGIDAAYVGKTYHEYFLDNALNSLREERALCAAAKDAGYTLSDSGKAIVTSNMESLDSSIENYLTTYGANLSRTKYLQMIYGITMTEKLYESCLERTQLADEFYNKNFKAITDYSDAELDAYYEANKDSMESVTFYQQAFTPETVETTDEMTEEEKTSAREEAVKAAEEAAQAALEKAQADFDSVKNDEAYTKSTGVLSSGTFYYDWLMDNARKSGDATVIPDSVNNYYVIVFEDRFRDETPTLDVRHILVEAKNEDDPATADVDESTQAPTDETYAAAKDEAQKLLDQWKAGEATEESFAALATEHSADPGSSINGGLYTNVAQGRMISNFNDWIFDEARKPGDVSDPIQNTESSTKGWHIIYYVGENDPVWVTTARQALWTDEVKENIEIVRTNKLDYVLQ